MAEPREAAGLTVERECVMEEISNDERAQLSASLAKLSDENEAQRRIIAKMKQAEEELGDRVEKYTALIESTDDSIYLLDQKSRYLFMNKKHLRRMGLHAEEVLGKAYGDFHSQEETSEFNIQVEKVLHTGESAHHEHKSARDGGFFLRTLSPVMDSSGNIETVTVISKNITPLKTLEAKLYALSLSDELTQLYNRRGFLALADQQLKISRRLERPMLLIFTDVDNFKRINDTYGHAEGDIALRDITEILKLTFRESDIIARIGGDEFIILITSFKAGTEDLYLNRLHSNIEQFNENKVRPYLVSMSTGLVTYDPSTSITIEEMISRADRSMYEQKAAAQKSRT
jgi:diguanylate cyclase (GGDEF)-like protein/PAS domain S-box-containing protein